MQVLGGTASKVVLLTAGRRLVIVDAATGTVVSYLLAVDTESVKWQPGRWQVTDSYAAIERLDDPDPASVHHYFTVGTVHRRRPVSRWGRPMSVLLTGLVMGESVRWHEGRLWFCDWGAGEIIALGDDGKPSVELRMPGLPFCIDWLPDGRMLITTAGRLLRREADGSLVTHAELPSPYPWNEVVVDRLGNAYVNNIGYDFPGGTPAPGFITVVTPSGSVREVGGDLRFPNGMAVIGDTLIVAESHASRLTAFDLAPDGTLSGQRGVGRGRRFRPGRHLRGSGRRDLVRRRPQPAVRPRPRRRRNPAHGSTRPRRLLLRPQRHRHALHGHRRLHRPGDVREPHRPAGRLRLGRLTQPRH